MTSDLPGWKYYQTVHAGNAVHSAGALENYQYPIKVLIGSGNGTSYTHEQGIGGSLIYVEEGKCRDDFYDFRFYVEGASCTYHRVDENTVAGVQSEFCVKVPSDLAGAVVDIVVYYGNFYAVSDVSSAASTYVSAPIGGVVGAWTLEEADTAINRIIIADDTQTAFFDSATPVGMTVTDDAITKTDGTDSLKVVLAHVGAYQTKMHTYSVNQDWSSKQFLRFNMYGLGAGFQFYIHIYATNTSNRYAYTVTDDTAGWKTVTIPFSSFSTIGSPSWSTVKQIGFGTLSGSDYNSTVYFDRWMVDVGVVAVDSSGYGNNGAATGTTIVTGKWTGKNGRQYLGGNEYIDCGTSATLNPANKITVEGHINLSASPIAYQRIYTRRNGTTAAASCYSLEMNSAGNKPVFWVSDGTTITSITATNALTPGQNYHVAGVYDGVNLKLYVDGSPAAADVPLSIALNQVATNTYIGRDKAGYPTIYFKGILSGIREYNTDLSQAQLTNISGYYPDTGLVVGSVCPRLYADTTNPTHDSWTPEVESTSGDENFYYYENTTIYPQKILGQTSGEGIDWSQAATDSHLLDLSSSRILEEAKQLGLIKRRK